MHDAHDTVVARNQSNIEQLLLKPPKFWKASWQDIHGIYHGIEKVHHKFTKHHQETYFLKHIGRCFVKFPFKQLDKRVKIK